MLTDLRVSDQWEQLNRAISTRMLGQDSREEIRVYRGIESAVWEVTQGAARLFPHRRKVIHVQHQDPLHSSSISNLRRDGFDVIGIPLSDLEQPQQLEKLIDLDTLLVLHSVDEPLTGRVFPDCPLTAMCDKKKAFAIQVNHHLHRLQPPSAAESVPSPYAISIKSFRHDLAIAHLGSKAKLGSAMTHFLDWESVDLQPLWVAPRAPSKAEVEVIQRFEDAGAGGAKRLWKASQARGWDRAVVYWDDLDGHAIIHYLAQELNLKLEPPGLEAHLETGSLSRWGGLRTMDWLKHHGLTPTQIRGSLIVHVSLLNPTFAATVAKVVTKVRQLQGF